MQRFDLYLANIQLRELRSISKKTGYSVAEIIRRAIDEYLSKQGMKKK